MDRPAPADLKARFPGFATVADAIVQAALDEAALQVGETWASEADARLGRLLLAAHVLTLDGQGSGAEAAAAAAGGFRRMRSGALELERPDTADAGPGALDSTGYGRRFLELMRRNVPAVTVV
ncbi:DUF4054 domain-containing protein [Inquilinus sp. Marseille-Q2685]|uniref:DUF4054 domain-containing protein n=1 Tax=Inquilinus sp. Marseille-Q2685 TaxID=2866581 RepID=UPI001CE49FE8|nr:DUF4054 domain-containing protein [Inquilinus sp. Marseille-Q2685]